MKAFLGAFLTVFALLGIVLAGLCAIDGILPMRSDGPNPNWIEVLVGSGLFLVGVVLLRMGRWLRQS